MTKKEKDVLGVKIEEAKKQLDGVLSLAHKTIEDVKKLNQLVQIGEFRSYVEFPDKPSYNTNWGHGSYQPSSQKKLEDLEAWFEKCKEIEKKNEPIKKHNADIRLAAIAFLKSLGLKEKYYYYKTTRSRSLTEGHSPWHSNILSLGKPKVHFQNIESNYKTLKRDYERDIKKQEDEKEQKKIKQEQIDKKRKTDMLIGSLATKYDIDTEQQVPDANDVLQVILNQNQYLKLAHYMELNRGDWSEGYDYARIGLNSFVVKTEEDQKIATDIESCMDTEDDGVDGRCFRDCTYNYSWLFDKVGNEFPELFADYGRIAELVVDEY